MIPDRRRAPLAFLCFLPFLLSACGPASRLIGDPQMPYPPTPPPEIGQILHMPTGVFVSEEQMLEIAGRSRIVYVGETHDNPASHRLQLSVLKAMQARHPGKIALGMEMFTPAQDEALRRWTAGETGEKEFLKEAGWFEVWKGDFAHYRDILNYCRDNDIPVIGLNADKKTVRLVVSSDPAELEAEGLASLPDMDLEDPYQRGMVEGIYGGHVKSEGMLAGFHRAQTLWDETMAESIVTFLGRDEYRDHHLVVIAGGNHVRYGFGIPRRVFRRLPLSYTLIGGKEIVIPESKKAMLMDVTLPKFPMTPYDFLVYLRYEELESREVKLGVMFDDGGGEVLVRMVAPGSNAERAGIRENDVILAVDGEDIQDSFDLVYAIQQKSAGDRGTVTVRRDGEVLEIAVAFLEGVDAHHGSAKE